MVRSSLCSSWRQHSIGCGFKTRKAEQLTEEEEEILWQKGLLGKSTPQASVDTNEWSILCPEKWQRT